jgi:acyl-CoA synthetase (AMP-forming)/AMP-acid ligase II/thioesterase domain-containing protein
MSNSSAVTASDFAESSIGGRSIVELISAHAISAGGKIAIHDGADKLTYRELMSRAAALAGALGKLPNPELPIGVLLPNSGAYIVAILALLIAGRTSVPMNDSHPEEHNLRLVARAGLKAVIADSETAPLMRKIAPDLPQVLIPANSAGIDPLQLPSHDSLPDHICTIIFTSGSSGEHKGVAITESAMLSRIKDCVPDSALAADDRIPLLHAMSGAAQVKFALDALSAGAEIGIIDLKRLGVSESIRLLEEFRPTVLLMVPTTFRALFGPDNAALARLTLDIRWVRLGGEPVLYADVQLYRRRFPHTCRLVVSVGTTETSTYVAWCIDHQTPLDPARIPVGYPLPGVALELIGDDGTDVDPGEIGEIFITGRTVADNYWRDVELTRARFGASSRFPGLLRYRTGDFGRFLAGGLLEFVGRRDRQVKIRANTVNLGQVEIILSGCPGVAEAGVVARQNGDETELAAYCAPAAGAVLADAQLRSWSRDHLTAPMRPTHFYMLASLPKLPTGKLDLAELALLDARQGPAGTHVVSIAPTSALSRLVRQAWAELLSEDSFDADTAFDAAGGDSLKGVNMMVRLEKLLGRDIAVGTLGLQTRPSSLIKRLQENAANSSAPDDRPLIVFFPAMWGDDVHSSDFYRLLSQQFRVIAIDGRLGGDPLEGEYDAERYFAAAQEQIRRAAPQRLWLMGFSYGGRLAAETARRLLATGVLVEALVVLDGGVGASARRFYAASRGPPVKLGERVRSGVILYGSLPGYMLTVIAVRLARIFSRYRAAGALRILIAVVARWGSQQTNYRVSRAVIALSRRAAFGDIPFIALPMPLWLFVTDDPLHDPGMPDLGWGARCRKVHRIPVGGIHKTMLLPPIRETIFLQLERMERTLRVKAKEIG